MKILVLGGGQQGRVIALDLAQTLTNTHVDVADVREPMLPQRSNLRWVEADLADVEAMAKRMSEYDLALAKAHEARKLGFRQSRLETLLKQKGKWKDPQE